VGPVWRKAENKNLLKKQLESCVVNILEMAKIIGAKSVSIPAISTGYFGFPRELCA